MNEDVLAAAIGCNETESLGIIEPLYSSLLCALLANKEYSVRADGGKRSYWRRHSCASYKNDLSWREREGWRSLRRALASIWRMRSRVTANLPPTSSSVCSAPSSRPKRILMIFSSREV